MRETKQFIVAFSSLVVNWSFIIGLRYIVPANMKGKSAAIPDNYDLLWSALQSETFRQETHFLIQKVSLFDRIAKR